MFHQAVRMLLIAITLTLSAVAHSTSNYDIVTETERMLGETPPSETEANRRWGEFLDFFAPDHQWTAVEYGVFRERENVAPEYQYRAWKWIVEKEFPRTNPQHQFHILFTVVQSGGEPLKILAWRMYIKNEALLARGNSSMLHSFMYYTPEPYRTFAAERMLRSQSPDYPNMLRSTGEHMHDRIARQLLALKHPETLSLRTLIMQSRASDVYKDLAWRTLKKRYLASKRAGRGDDFFGIGNDPFIGRYTDEAITLLRNDPTAQDRKTLERVERVFKERPQYDGH